MKKIVTFFINITILLVVSVVIIWLIIARPMYFTSTTYSPEYTINLTQLAEQTKTLSENFSPRDSNNPENLINAAKYIEHILKQSSNNVLLTFYDVNGKKYTNVTATYGPDSEAVIIIGAHYDAYSTFPGADDNASGVAGLLALGTLIKNLNLKTKVELVAYTLEEPPNFATANMGSSHHAKELRLKNKKIKIMISLEMIGYFSEEEQSQDYPSKLLSLMYPNKGNFIAVVDHVFSNKAQKIKSAINRHTDLPAYSINAPAFIPGIDFSDHRSYWINNYSAVMITDTSFYRNFKYHTIDDTYDRLNYKKMAKVIYGIFKYVEELDTKT